MFVKKFLAIQKSKKAKPKKDLDVEKLGIAFPQLALLLSFSKNADKNIGLAQYYDPSVYGVKSITSQFQRIEAVLFNKSVSDERLGQVMLDIFKNLDANSAKFLSEYIL